MWYSLGMIAISIVVTIVTSVIVSYWAWGYITSQEYTQKRGFSWHSFFRNTLYACVGENKGQEWSLEIRYNMDIRRIKNLHVLSHSYSLCIPFNTTMSEFKEYASSLNPKDNPLHKLIRAVANEEELSSLELNERELEAFQEFKNNIINLVLVKD